MKHTHTLAGQSLILNALFVTINLTGLTFLVMGYHEAFETSKTLFLILGYSLMSLSVAGIIIFKGRMFMSYVSRLLVGGLFIVSGLIKANDPLGFSYKLEEYFEDGALAFRIKEWFGAPGFSLEFLIEWALVLSVLICVIEIVLGVLVIIGGKIKLSSWLLVLMMLFFTFLTWHTANCDPDKKFIDRDTYDTKTELAQIKLEESKTNKDIKIVSNSDGKVIVDEKKSPQCVTDCGCFGDAMKGSLGRSLTPKESLWKDIVLLYLVIWIFISQRIIQPNTIRENKNMVPISLLIILFFSFVFGWYFPLLFGLVAILGSLWILKAGGRLLGNHWGGVLVVSILCFTMTSYVLRYEPIKDYRPYAEGSNLKEKMRDGVPGEFVTGFILKNKKTNLEEFFTEKEYMDTAKKIWENPTYEFVRMDQKVINPGKLPSIDSAQFNPFISPQDLSPAELKMKIVKEILAENSINGVVLLDKVYNTEIKIPEEEYNVEDYDTTSFKFLRNMEIPDPSLSEVSIRDFILESKTIFILFSKNLNEANMDNIDKIRAIYSACSKSNIPMILVTSASRPDIDAWRKKYKMDIPTFTNDGIELKAIARSNPNLMIIQQGVVKGKYPHRSIPSFDWIQKHILSK
jgi:uncharacterized membrane protein YphA (DoxX/SURF4 family)